MEKPACHISLGKRRRRSRNRFRSNANNQKSDSRFRFEVRPRDESTGEALLGHGMDESMGDIERQITQNQVANPDVDGENNGGGLSRATGMLDTDENQSARSLELDADAVAAHQKWRETMLMDDEAQNFRDEPNSELVDAAAEADMMVVPTSANSELRDMVLDCWRTIWGLIMTTGSRKLTKLQYQSVRVAMDCVLQLEPGTDAVNCDIIANRRGALPHFSTLFKTVKPVLFRLLTARSVDAVVPIDTRKAGARCSLRSDEGEPQAKVRIVLPSEHARADVGTPHVFDAMLATSLETAKDKGHNVLYPGCIVDDCIDLWPIVSARDWFYGPPSCISVDWSTGQGYGRERSLRYFAEKDDTLKLTFLHGNAVDVEESVSRAFGPRTSSEARDHLLGEVVHIWTIHHSKRKIGDEVEDVAADFLSTRDKMIVRTLNWVNYRSPSDEVSIQIPCLPEEETEDLCDADGDNELGPRARRKSTPAMREATRVRQSAMRERKKLMEVAWASWTKPFLKPGDTVALLRPLEGHNGQNDNTLLTNTDRDSRLIVVYRFWVEQEERSRHALWIPGGCDVSAQSSVTNPAEDLCGSIDGTGRRFVDIKSAVLVGIHSNPRGPDRFMPVSSVGVLANGERYCVYRFLIFWDGFEVESGKSASGEGVYLICLNLNEEARATPKAVRIISLTPPGVKSDTVLTRIMNDVREGMVEGFLDVDATGTTRRIFLDLVGVVGDTPAINSAIDVLGHTGSSFCHLCRVVRRSATTVGSRYTSLSSNASLTAHSRRFLQHQAVRDASAQSETCKLLGMKPFPTRANYILQELRSTIVLTLGCVPMTSSNQPVVPSTFDPYRGSMVAPDHLLTGHLRDCLNLAIRLMPNAAFRATCEAFLLAYLRDCRLPEQNRIIDMEQKRLFSMSMTELYALGVIAHIALRQACSWEEKKQVVHEDVKIAYSAAVDLVGSCGKLISLLLYKPNAVRDGREAVDLFEKDGGRSHVEMLQKETEAHIVRVETICKLSEDDFCLIDVGSGRVNDVSMANKRLKMARTAISCVYKPNVHRLLELVHSTLPMTGHVIRCGELVMEKAHQSLKRAVKQSNHKDIHLQAMTSAIFNDWQGRLTLAVREYPEKSSVLSCFRLLSGREAVMSVSGCVDRRITEKVRSVLGPANCVQKELISQNQSVLGTVHRKCAPVFKEIHPIRSVPIRSSASAAAIVVPHSTAFIRLMARRIQGEYISASSGVTISTSSRAVKLEKGDVVSALCYNPADINFHFPLVMLKSNFSTGTGLSYPTGPMLWCISRFFSATSTVGSPLLYAVVHPVVFVHPIAAQATPYGENGPQRRSIVRRTSRYFMAISESVDKVATIRYFGTDSERSTPLICAAPLPTNPLDGAPFFVISAKQGYPPRQG